MLRCVVGRGVLAGVLIAIASAIAGPAAAQTDDDVTTEIVCGSAPSAAGTAPVGMVEAPTAGELKLGRSDAGTRRIEFEFVFSGCVPPDDVPVRFGVFSGDENDLDEDDLTAEPPDVDGNTARVTIVAHRSRIDAGEYKGRVHVGNAKTGTGSVELTVKHQQSFWPWPLLLGLLAAIGGVVLAGIHHLYKREEAAPQGTAAALEDARHNRRRIAVRAGWWLLRFAASISRGVYLVARKLVTTRNAWAALVGLGAAVTAFTVTYIDNPAWAFSLGSDLKLITAVGAAAFAASFAAWHAPQVSSDPPTPTPPTPTPPTPTPPA